MKINIPESDKERVVIVGAGFAGLTLARKLVKSNYQVVLIDKNNYHQFQPLFYQVAMAGLEPSSIVFPLRKVFQRSKNVFIRITEVQSIDVDKKQLHTQLGHCNYDHLVIAFGADTNYYGNKELSEKVIPMKSVAEALYLRNAVLSDLERALSITDYNKRQELIDIVIVGGGPTGVEVAGALAEMKNYILPKDYPELNCKEIDIYLIQSADTLLKGMSNDAAEAAERFLKERGVIVRKNVRLERFSGTCAYMNDGTEIPTRKVIWAAGITGNSIQGLPKECCTYGNRLQVNRFNEVAGLDNVYAIGDIAYMEEEAYPKGHPQVAQVAIQQAKNLANNFKNKSKNKTLVAFTYNDLGSMATIGRNKAVVDLPRFKFQGFFAWVVWMAVHLFSIIGVKNRIFVLINWVWNYFTYDQSLRLLIKPRVKPESTLKEKPKEEV